MLSLVSHTNDGISWLTIDVASFTYSASENQVSFNVDAPEGWSDLKATAEVTGETLIATTKPRCANLAASVNRCTIDFTLTKKN